MLLRQTPLHIAFMRMIAENEEIEIVRIFGDVLREIAGGANSPRARPPLNFDLRHSLLRAFA
jgi:hypothetical protein